MLNCAQLLIKENKDSKSKILDLGNCGLINELPEELFDCYWLEELTLGSWYWIGTQWSLSMGKQKKNKFDTLELDKLGNLKNLKRLNLSFLKISNISFLKNLVNLESLDLSYNNLRGINEISNLKQLRVLHLSHNKIEDLDGIVNLYRLEYLSLNSNNINKIGSLKTLIHLTELNLMNNLIEDIEPLKYLTALTLLNLKSNKINNIWSLGTLSNLIKLNLTFNRIKKLDELVPLINLNMNLNICDVILTGADKEIALAYNPITFKSSFRLTEDLSSDFLRKLAFEGTEYLYEAKLAIVGDGGVGKTSLQRKIINKNAPLPLGNDSTRGIKVYDWQFENSYRNSIKVHIWDFGGQDIYYPVHRFFLSENSLYVLMSSTRFHNHGFDYWIPTIYQFGGRSPILIVQNCDHGNKRVWADLISFYANPEYNLTHPYHQINLIDVNHKGLDNLRSEIENRISFLPHIGNPVPKSWVRIREELEKKSLLTSYISFDDFIVICRKVDFLVFGDITQIEYVCRYFHNLGIILWYSKMENLRHLIVLRPEWAINALYLIIDDTDIQTRNGLVTEEDFNRLWGDDIYRPKIAELKMMLRAFKIAFPQRRTQKGYLLPLRMIHLDVSKLWQPHESMLQIQFHFDVLPKGIINEFSALMSNYIPFDEMVWSNAVRLQSKFAQAEIYEDGKSKTINIKVVGDESRSFIVSIIDNLNEIINEYRGVIPTIKVPCNCKVCNNSKNSFLYDYEDLLKFHRERRRFVTCYKSEIKVSIHTLLYNLGFTKLNESEMHNKSVYFSYAWSDGSESAEHSLESIVNNLYESIKADNINVIIDKIDLGYKESISEFMQEIGRADFIVVALSDKYLKSPNCMFELYEIFRNSKLEKESFIDKIYPIRVENLSLSSPKVLDKYFEHWEKLELEWAELIMKRGIKISAAQKLRHDRIKAISTNLGDILDILNDINSSSKEVLSENNFEKIKEEIQKKMITN